MWSDETLFHVAGNRGGNRYSRSDPLYPRYTRLTEKFPDNVMTCGAFGFYDQLNLVMLPGNENLKRKKKHLPRTFV